MKKLAVLLLSLVFALTVCVTASAATASPESGKSETSTGSQTDKSDKTGDMGVLYLSAAMLSSAAAGVVAKKKLSK